MTIVSIQEFRRNNSYINCILSRFPIQLDCTNFATIKSTYMTVNRLIFLLSLACCTSTANAQMERTMYQVFEVDSAKTVALDIVGIYEIHSWAGSSILVETNIQIWEGSREILNYLIKEGRYDVSMDSTAGPTPTEMKIYTKNKERKPIKRLDGQKCLEIATAKFFIPDTFIVSEDKKLLTRKEKPVNPDGGG